MPPVAFTAFKKPLVKPTNILLLVSVRSIVTEVDPDVGAGVVGVGERRCFPFTLNGAVDLACDVLGAG